MISAFPFQALAPLILLTAASCIGLLVPKLCQRRLGLAFFSLTLLGCAWLSGFLAPPSGALLGGMFIQDALSRSLQVCIALGAWLSLIYGWPNALKELRYEYLVLALIATLGMMILASAGHMLVLYLGLELMSLALYVMVAVTRSHYPAVEAAMKYFVLGAISSVLLLFGISLLYGLSGTLVISEVQAYLLGSQTDPLQALALALILVSLAFKLGVAPFHTWVPDVYTGAPTLSVQIIAGIAKIGAFAMILRLLIGALEPVFSYWQPMLIVLGALSIIVGAFSAVMQNNIKRLLGYSAVNHMGYVLLGLVAVSSDGYAASLFYLLIYVLTSIAAFGMLLMLNRNGQSLENVSDLKGLAHQKPLLAVLVLVLMLSLAGIPPTMGFFAKLAIIEVVIDSGLLGLAIMMGVVIVVSAFYYLRILKMVFFERSDEDHGEFAVQSNPLLLLLSVHILLLLIAVPWSGTVLEFSFDTVLKMITL